MGLRIDVEAADFAFAVDDLFVGQNGPQRRAPVDRHFRHIGQPPLEQLQENPLCPAVIARVGRAEFAVPVVRQSDPLHLPLECRDVLSRRDGRMDAGLHRILFSRQPEGVPAHRMQHVEALHAFVARDDVGRRIAFEMADMQAGPGGIREHVEAVKLGLGRIFHRPERAMLFPVGLPLRFNGVMIVGFTHAVGIGLEEEEL